MKTILILDGSAENRLILKTLLVKANYIVIEANDGEVGLEQLRKNKIDLIISETLMPVMDGFLFCKACKKDKLLKDIPFVFYTSNYTDESDRQKALKLGASKYLIDPVDSSKVLTEIKRLFTENKPKLKQKEEKKFIKDEVSKLYNERLIGDLEQKNIDLSNEIIEQGKTEQLLISKNEILDLFTKNIPLNKIFDQLLLNFEAIHPDYFGSISLVDKEGVNLILESAPSLPESYCLAIKSLPILNNSGSCPTAAFTKKPVIVTDITTDELWVKHKDLALKYGLKSCWSIPILSKDNLVLGTFAIYSKSIKSPTIDEIREVDFAVSLANIALEKSRIILEIKKKDESYYALINQASDAILTYTFDGVIHEFNQAIHQILGYTSEEFSKLKIQDIIVGDFVTMPDVYSRILEGQSVFFERQLICKNKAIVDVEISAKKQKDGRVLSIGRNITERKKEEAKLIENAYFLRQSQKVANIGSYTVDLKTKIWTTSSVLDEIFGLDESFVKTVEGWNSLVHPDEREALLEYFSHCVANNKKVSIEYRVIKHDTQEEIWVNGFGELIFDSENQPTKMIGSIQDITHQKKSEIKLKEREYFLRQSQIVANIGSYSLDIKSGIWESSAVLDGIFGINKSFLRNVENWIGIIHDDDKEVMLNHLQLDVIKNHKKFNKEYRLKRRVNNKDIWVHGIGELIFDSEGNPDKMIGVIQDITERKTAEVKILEREYHLRQSQKVANIGSYTVDLENETWTGSSVLDEIFGIDESYPKTVESWNNRIHIDERKELLNYFKYCVANNERFNKEYRVIKHDTQEEIWVHGIGELIFDSENKPTNLIGTIQDITQRKQSEIKLQESEYSLRQSQKVANIGSYVWDLSTRTWESSTVLNSIFGIHESYVKTIESWVTLIHPDEKEEMFNYLENNIVNRINFNKEYRVVKLDSKEEIWVYGIGELIYDSDGNPVKLIGTMQDITERKRSRIKLQESEKSLLTAQKLAKIGSFNLDINSLVGETSITFKEIIGVDHTAEVNFPLWKSIVHPEDRALIKDAVIHSQKNKEKFSLEYRIISKDKKKLKWIHGLGEIIYAKGKAISFIGTIQDITERKKIELDLSIANKFSSSLLKSMHEGLIAINLDSEIVSVNPAFCEMTGFAEDELIGVKRPYPFSPPELRKENDARYKLLLQNKNESDYENTYMRKNGERFPVHVMVSSIYDENGEKTANFATIEDITERRNAEINLQLAKAFNDKLIMSMQEGLLILDMLGKVIKVNDSLCKLLGYSEQELIGLELPYPFAREEDFERMQEIKAKVTNDEAPTFQLEFTRKNGSQFIASFLTGTIKNDNGDVIAIFATIKDVSEEEKAKKVLEENAKKSLERKNVIIELASLVGTDYKDALNKITALSAKTLNVERGSVLKFNKEKTEIFCEKSYTRKNDSYESGQVYSREINKKYFETINKGKLVRSSKAQTYDIFKGFLEDHLIPLNIKSKLSIPIQGINEVYGILCFEEIDVEHFWTTDEEEFATSIANLVSLMIQANERKLAEEASILANNQLTLANNELNKLRNQLEQENVYLRDELGLVFNYEDMVYGSAEFSSVLTELEKVAPTKATVLLLGESGTGKELLARAIQNISTRNNKPLIKVNCAAIPRELLESELFGHKKGSFTGAFNDKIGKFELADQGTLFLDEIGELPLDMQPKILRFLQEGEIEVVGGAVTKKLDVRVIAATNRDLREEIDKKRFREDLFFRLNVFPIKVPALRNRKDDIPLLVEHFVEKFNKDYGKNIKYIADEAMNKLKNYKWPGNIRELENLIERAAILSTDETLSIPGFESSNQMVNPINKKDLSLDVAQRNHILRILKQCDWKISGPNGASELLAVKPSTLRDKMKKLDLKKPD